MAMFICYKEYNIVLFSKVYYKVKSRSETLPLQWTYSFYPILTSDHTKYFYDYRTPILDVPTEEKPQGFHPGA